MKICAFFVLAGFALTACGDHVTETTGMGTPPIKISGVWTYTIDISAERLNASCKGNGTVTLNQVTNAFTGSVFGTTICKSDTGTEELQPLFLNFTNGEIAGLGVRFLSFLCVYTGAADSLVTQLSGMATCIVTLPEAGGPATLTGPWRLSR